LQSILKEFFCNYPGLWNFEIQVTWNCFFFKYQSIFRILKKNKLVDK
jgi:hypothetical protein